MDFQRICAEVRGLGGEIYGVTAQDQAAADKAKETWDLAFPMLSDPQVVIGEDLYTRGLLDIYVDGDLARELQESSARSGRQLAGGSYAIGLYQPAVIVLTNDFTPLFSWASVPTASNFGGASGRPRAKAVRKAIDAGLQGDFSLVKWQPPSFGKFPIQLFFALLMANGNFIRPGFFVLDEHGQGSAQEHLPRATGKLAASIGMLGMMLHQGRPRVRLAIGGAAAAYVAYVKMAWGPTLQQAFKTGGADPSRNVLYQRRSKL